MIQTIFDIYSDITKMGWSWFLPYWFNVAVLGLVLSGCAFVAFLFSNRGKRTTSTQDDDAKGYSAAIGLLTMLSPVLATVLFWATLAIIPALGTMGLVLLYERVTHKEELPEAKVINGGRL